MGLLVELALLLQVVAAGAAAGVAVLAAALAPRLSRGLRDWRSPPAEPAADHEREPLLPSVARALAELDPALLSDRQIRDRADRLVAFLYRFEVRIVRVDADLERPGRRVARGDLAFSAYVAEVAVADDAWLDPLGPGDVLRGEGFVAWVRPEIWKVRIDARKLGV